MYLLLGRKRVRSAAEKTAEKKLRKKELQKTNSSHSCLHETAAVLLFFTLEAGTAKVRQESACYNAGFLMGAV